MGFPAPRAGTQLARAPTAPCSIFLRFSQLVTELGGLGNQTGSHGGCLPANVPCSRPYSYSPTLSPGREQRCSSWPQEGVRVLLLRRRGDGPSCSCGGTPFPHSCSVLVALLLLNVSISGGGEGHPLHSLEPDQKPWLCSPLCMMQMLRCTKPTMTTKKRPCTAASICQPSSVG